MGWEDDGDLGVKVKEYKFLAKVTKKCSKIDCSDGYTTYINILKATEWYTPDFGGIWYVHYISEKLF